MFGQWFRRWFSRVDALTVLVSPDGNNSLATYGSLGLPVSFQLTTTKERPVCVLKNSVPGGNFSFVDSDF